MRPVLAIVSTVLLATVAGCSGCREEPTIVIKFEPQDLAKAAGRTLVDAAPAVVVDAASTAAAPAPAKTEAEPCKTDKDCALSPAECCDCANGGEVVAVRKTSVKARAQKCGATTMCVAMLSTHPSCQKVAACVAGQCALADPPAPKKPAK